MSRFQKPDNGQSPTNHKSGLPNKRILLIEQLEERVLFDAVPINPADVQPDMDTEAMAFVQTSTEVVDAESRNESIGEQQSAREVVFVDKGVSGYESLVAELVNGRDVDVYFVNEGSAGLSQIADRLQDHNELSAIHIISHGNDAELFLGNSQISSANLSGAFRSDLERIGNSLSEAGDILLYGCDLAGNQQGIQFIETLSQITRADVAASDDLTGSSRLGGDWILEKSTGAIETQTLHSDNYQSVLLETDAGFIVGTASFGAMDELAVTPLSEGGVSSRTYDNAATANSGAITIDLRLTLIDTFDENGNVTTGTANQLPVTFSDFAGGPVLLARVPGGSANGYEGHTAHVMVEFFDASDGNPLSVVGDFTFKDIDYEAPTATGSGSEAVKVVSDQMQSYQISSTPASSIETIVNGDGTTTFTNTTTRGGEADEERWISIKFHDMPQLNLRFTARNANTGYGLSTANFSATPLSFSQPDAVDDDFTTDQDTSISGNLITGNNGNGIDSDSDGDTLTVSQINGDGANVGTSVAGSFGGVFTVNSNGSFDFDPANDFDFLASGETITTTITYAVTDGTGIEDEATVTVTVTGTNDNPTTVGTIPPQSNNDGDTIAPINISGYFADADTTDLFTFSAGSTLPPGLNIDPVSGIISGTINNNASVSGPFVVMIVANDGNGGTITQTFTWAVANPGPTATNNSANVKEDTTLTDNGNVIANDDGFGVDSDPDNDSLSVSQVNGNAANVGVGVAGSYGTVFISGDGTYTYTLDNNNATVSALDNGDALSEAFTYTVSDGQGGTSTATLTVNIDGTNDAPLVGGTIPNQSDTDADTIPGLDVSSYFSDPEGDALTYGATNLPAGLTIDPVSGLITGTIDNSASQGGAGGVYTVTVTATDDNGDSVSTTLTWTASNPGPTATDNSATVTEDTSLSDSGNVISDNDGSGVDSDPDGDSLTVGAVAGSAGNVGVATSGTFGSIVVNSNGSYTYTLDNNNPAVSALDNGETLTETFSYTLTDEEGGTSTADITITIHGTNDTPLVASTIPNQSDNDAETISTLDVSAFFSDPDGDALTYGASNLPAGLLIDPVSGLITGTIDNSASQGGSGGVYTVTVTATDDNGESVSTTLTWTVANPGPSATDNTAAVTEDSSLTDSGSVISDNDGSGIDNDPDADTLTVNAVNGSAANVGLTVAGSYGDIVINSDGSYVYSLNNSDPAVSALDNGETLSDTFTYTVSDGEGGTSTATLTVTVNGSNDAPLVGGTIPNQSNDDADSISTLDVSAFFSDPDGDALTYGASNLPAGLLIDPVSGLITGTIDNSASQGGSGGVYTVTVTATDDNGESVSTTLDWAVSNPAPVANSNTASVIEDTSLTDSGNVMADDDGTGIDQDPDSDPLTVSAVDGAAGNVGVTVNGAYGSIEINSDGTYTYNLNNNHPSVSSLDNGETLSDFFTYSISDGEGGSSTSVLTVTINGSNDAPVSGGTIPDQFHDDADTIGALDISSYFNDPDGDTLTYSATDLPGGLSIDSITGLITGTIDNSASQGGAGGVYTVSASATDDNGQAVTVTFDWNVSNPGPTATDDSGSTTQTAATAGNVLSNDSDTDGDSITVSAVGGSAGNVAAAIAGSTGGQFTINSNGSWSFDPAGDFDYLADGQAATTSINYSVSDGEGGAASATLTVTVTGTNDVPVGVGLIPPQASLDGATIAGLDVSGYFSDLDTLDSLSFSAAGLPAGLSISNTGIISGSIDNSASQSGPFLVTIMANDGNGGSVDQTFAWDVTNPGPTATDNSANVTENTMLADSGNVISDDDGWGVDNDPDSDAIQVSAVEGSSASVGVTINGAYGDIVINSNGSYTYTLDSSNPAVTSLDAGDTLTETFSYAISDGEGGSSSALLTITVNGQNDVPVLGGTIPDQASLDSQAIATLDVSSFFSDPEGLSLTFSATDLPAGLAIDPLTGNLTGTLDSSASAGGTAGVHTVTITATDNVGQSVSTTFDWTVTNPAPTAVDDTRTIDEDTSLSDSVASNDSDIDGDSLTFAQTSGPSDGSLTFNSDGSFTYTPNPNFNGTDSFDYQVTDANGAVSTATVTITVDPVNDDPILVTPIGDQSNVDSETISLDISGLFSDVEGHALTFAATGLPTGLTIDVSGNISGTIDSSASASGPFTVLVTVTDGNGGVVTDTFSWVVANPAPAAVGDSFATNEDTPVSGSVASNDSDPDGDTLNYVKLTDPANGTVVFNSDGTFTYTPTGDFHGPDSFDYQAIDADGEVSTATVNISVDPVNDPPVVISNVPDQSSNDSDPIILDVSTNFSDVEGDGLTFSATGLPTGLSIDGTGNITGTIDSSASASGPFTVVVTANDGNGGTVTDTFTWTVANPAPTAGNDGFTTNEDTAVSGTVAGNDGDVDGDTVWFTQLTNPANGTVAFNSNGSFTYTPDADFFGSDSFDYQITDADGSTAVATVTIAVDPVNDEPVVGSPIADQTSLDSEAIVVDVSSHFSDPEGNTLFFSAAGLPTGLTMDSSGIITGTIDSSASSGSPFTVVVTVVDGNGGTVTDTFSWTVSNPAPDAVNDSVTTNEDTLVGGNVSTNDSDPDGDATSFNQLTSPSNGTLVFNNDGTFTYDPNADFSGIDSFDYEIVDADGSSTTATVTIVVGDVNDPPSVSIPIADRTDLDGATISVDVSGNFSDVEGDGLTFSATGLPAGLSMTTGGVISGTIDNSASTTGPHIVIVTADDGNGGTVTDTFTWTVNNPAPNATNNTSSVTEDSGATGIGNVISGDDGSGVDSDPDHDALAVAAVDGLPGSVGVTVGGVYGTIQINGDGSYVYTLDNNHPTVNALDNGESLSESFSYTISDGEGGTSTATLTVTIDGTNDAPNSLGTITDRTNLDADAVTFDISTFFADVDGDILTYSVAGLPNGLTLDPVTGVISGIVDNDASQGGPGLDGVYSVLVTGTDDDGETVSSSFTWTVTNPVPIAQDDSFSILEDGALSGSVVGNDSDPDFDAVTYSMISGPTDGSITFNSDGTFSYTPNADFFGTDTFDYEICDANGDCSTATVTINIASVNDAPTVSLLPNLANVDSDPVSVDVSSYFADTEGDSLTFLAADLPTGLTMDLAGNITGTIDSSASAGGPFNVVVTANDGNGGSSMAHSHGRSPIRLRTR